MNLDKIHLRKNDQEYTTPEACNFNAKLRKNVDRLGFELNFHGST